MTRLLFTCGAVWWGGATMLHAGDDPMSGATITDPVEALLSDDAAERSQAVQRILEDRQALIERVCAILTDRKDFWQRSGAIQSAIAVLDEFRAPEAAEALAGVIAFPDVGPPDDPLPPFVSPSFPVAPFERRLPAVKALLRIGDPCIDAVIDKLATTQHVLEIEICEYVLLKLKKPKSIMAKVEARMKEEYAAGRGAFGNQLLGTYGRLVEQANAQPRKEE